MPLGRKTLVLLLLLIAASISAAAQPMTHVPFRLTASWDGGSTHRFSATLNQDGSWTYEGNLEAALEAARPYDPGTLCVIDGLGRLAPPNNSAPATTGPISHARMAELICADPVLRPCLTKLHITFGGDNWPSCEQLISLRWVAGAGSGSCQDYPK